MPQMAIIDEIIKLIQCEIRLRLVRREINVMRQTNQLAQLPSKIACQSFASRCLIVDVDRISEAGLNPGKHKLKARRTEAT